MTFTMSLTDPNPLAASRRRLARMAFIASVKGQLCIEQNPPSKKSLSSSTEIKLLKTASAGHAAKEAPVITREQKGFTELCSATGLRPEPPARGRFRSATDRIFPEDTTR